MKDKDKDKQSFRAFLDRLMKFFLDKINLRVEVKDWDQIPPLNSPQLSPKVSEAVALCLVVPASALGKIQENDPINVSDIATLIENALYFICTTPEDVNTIEPRLRLDENITNVSEQREFYVRININDGKEMRDKRVPYILKKNLPSNGQGTVEKLACLEYLSVSGLENFNRI